MPCTNSKTIQILLVEDNPGDARLFQEILKEVRTPRFELTHVETIKAALDLVSENSFNVILLDLSLPDAHGVETIEKMHHNISELPIVVLTGTDDEELALRAVQTGAQDYLVKGQVDNNLLARAIRYAIERKKTELEREIALTKVSEANRLSTVGTLAAGIAHELNQPLQTFKFGISNLKRMSRNGKLTSEIMGKKLEKMDQLTDYMAQIITNLLGYVRPDEDYAEHRLYTILTAVLSMIGKQLSSNAVHVELNIPDDFTIYCNRNAVTQVFINLFINAKDAYLEIPVKVALDVDRRIAVSVSKDSQSNHIYVKDWAGGIKSSIRNQVFDPFVSSKPAVKGTGMGLHVVRQIMVGHHGDVLFTVEDGSNTTFELIFPVVTTSQVEN